MTPRATRHVRLAGVLLAVGVSLVAGACGSEQEDCGCMPDPEDTEQTSTVPA